MAAITLKINGKDYKVDGRYSPDFTLSDFIRTVAHLHGTKVMCKEGGCGACVVAVQASLPPTYEARIFSVNSCLVSALSCHGWEVTTAEGLGNRSIGYHEVQERLAKFNGTQCGYCTPGWTMNMYSIYSSKNKQLTMKEVENSFASNICRCTGYRSIAEAFKTLAIDADKKLLDKLSDIEDLGYFKPCGLQCKSNCCHKNVKNINNDPESGNWCVLENSNKVSITLNENHYNWYKVYKLEEVFAIMKNGNYKLIAGNTGHGVFYTTDYPENLIDIFDVIELKEHMIDVNLILGAGMTLTSVMELFSILSAENDDFFYFKQLQEHLDLVAHIPVRNIGTIGGNLMLKHFNNSFQSDIFLLFETVGAMITITDSIESKNVITLSEFLTTKMEGKVIINVILPPLSQSCSLKTYKIMPRSQNSHAVVNFGVLFTFHHNSDILTNVRIVYGGISAKFIHATNTESILVGKDPYTNDNLQLALKTLSNELATEDNPPEPSAEYRKMLALALYYKAILFLAPDNKIDPEYRSGGKVIKREISNGTQVFETDKTVWPVNQPIPKLEALIQCAGESVFTNDMSNEANEVFAAFVTADVNPGSVISNFDTKEAFELPGVIAFYSAKDIPGVNTFTPTNVVFMTNDEEILCSSQVKFYGQPVGIIVADSEKKANDAAKLVKINYVSINNNKPILTLEEVLSSPEKEQRLINNQILQPTNIGNDVKHVVKGNFNMEGQYHFHMETHSCIVKPTEEGLEVYSATQWLDLTNIAVATCLNVPVNSITVIVRRLGGGYGGKISRPTQVACAAALVTYHLRKTCRFVLSLQTNMKVMGKRLPTNSNYEVGVNSEGEIQYLKNTYYQDNGHSLNESMGSLTLFHLPNCYDSSRWMVDANTFITDTSSNTWCRAPGSTEAIAMMENIMEHIAHVTNVDPIQVRLMNMKKGDNPIPKLIDQLKNDSDYDRRLIEIQEFNKQNRWRKQGLKLAPLTIGISYLGNFNAIVSVYHGDGTVTIIHGGIEMGQGINTKTAQVCAYMFGIPIDKISVKPSTSATSPNVMTTGGSIGSESVAFATMKACETILKRLEAFRQPDDSWEDVVRNAYAGGIDLQASYMFSNVAGDAKSYDVYAVCALEVEVDILTGNHDVLRVDLLEDTGRSLNPEIDVTQIEGAFVMGLGYWSSEKLVYDSTNGKLLTDRTWNYKPPGIKDIPADFRIYFRRNARNEVGVLQSKATGEPALCLATVFVQALRAAVRSARLDAGYEDNWVQIENPCTVENIFMSVGHNIEKFVLK